MCEIVERVAALQMTKIAVVFGVVLLMVLLMVLGWILLARLWRIGTR